MKRRLTRTRATIASADVRRILLAIMLLSTLLRVGVGLYQGDEVDTLPGIYDQVSYHTLATRVLDGDGFSFGENWWPATKAGQPTAHWSFLYTLYLVAVYGLFGVHPLVARLIQSVLLGVLQPWLTWRIGRRLFSDRIALLAAGISAVYAYFAYYAGALMSEGFYIVAVLWVFDSTMRLGESGQRQDPGRESLSTWWTLGLAIGTAVLLRQVFLLMVPLLFAWIIGMRLWRPASDASAEASRRTRRSLFRRLPLKGLLAGTGVIFLMIVPWTIRNYLAFNQFVLLNTNAGFVVFWGNHPIHKDHFIPILPPGGPSYADLLPISLKKLDEAALDRALMKRGIGFMLADPIRFAKLSLSRCVEYFRFWPSSGSSLAGNLARLLSFGIVLPFVLVGIGSLAWGLVLRHRPRDSEENWNAGLLLVFVFFYSLIHCLSWTLIRYRLPVDAVLVMFSASGIWICTVFLTEALARIIHPGSLQHGARARQ